MCMEKLKNKKKNFFVRTQKINPYESTIVTNESDKILVISIKITSVIPHTSLCIMLID